MSLTTGHLARDVDNELDRFDGHLGYLFRIYISILLLKLIIVNYTINNNILNIYAREKFEKHRFV